MTSFWGMNKDLFGRNLKSRFILLCCNDFGCFNRVFEMDKVTFCFSAVCSPVEDRIKKAFRPMGLNAF